MAEAIANGVVVPVTADDGTELYIRHRPTRFEDIVGQEDAVRQIVALLKARRFPRVSGYVGPSGCGKTTVARIVKRYLGCKGADFQEINAAASRGIDMVRDVQARMGLAPAFGTCRVWLIDECGKLTPDAQAALLKILEPEKLRHCYFMLATTDPQKLLPTIISRWTEFKFKLLTAGCLTNMVGDVCAKENIELAPATLAKLADTAAGNGRKALVLLHQIRGLKTPEAQQDALEKADEARDAFELVQLLIWRRPSWESARKLIEEINLRVEDVERFRQTVLSCAAKELVKDKGNYPRAAAVIRAFKYPFYDCKQSGVYEACYDVLGQK